MKKPPPQSLFPAGPPVEGKALVGREDIIQDILRLLEIGQSCILIAPRRYGKTSVIIEVLNRLRHKGHFTALMDLFAVHSKRMFADKLTACCLANNPGWVEKSWDKIKRGGISLLESLRFKPAVADTEVVLQLEFPHADVDALLDRTMDFPERFAKRYKKSLLFAFDEFQSILDFADLNLVKTLRSHIQHHRWVRYLFTGSQEGLMTQLFKHKRHAFYRFGRIIELGPISKEYFVPYIVGTFRNQKITVDETIAEAVCDRTGGQPYYTQLLCQMLFERMDRLNKKVIKQDELEQAITDLIAHEEGLFSDWWDRLSKRRHSHAILSYIASGRSPYEIPDISKANINRVITDLKRLGYITREERPGRTAHFFIRDVFFAQYIRKFIL